MTFHVWEKSYPAGVSWGDPLPASVPLESFLIMAADQWPDRVAIDFYDRKITYRELHKLAERTAKGFQALGVVPGSRVALHLPNTPHYVACFFGILMAGGTVVNLSPMIGVRELSHHLQDTDARVLVTFGERSYLSKIASLGSTIMLDAIVRCDLDDFLPAHSRRAAVGLSPVTSLGMKGEISFRDLTANVEPCERHAHHALEDEIAVIQYTGGTTGEMKGAMLSHANFAAIVFMQRRWYGKDHRTDTPGQDPIRALVVLPFFHILGLSCMMLLSIASGFEIVLHIRFDPGQVLKDISRKKIQALSGVPAMFNALAAHSKIGDFDLSSLIFCSSGGAPLPPSVSKRFARVTGVSLSEGYGLTEMSPLATMQPAGCKPRSGNVGLPLPNTLVEIVDLEDGSTVLPAGARGEVCFSGPQLMKGYWRRPEATAEAIRGGRFHTGDIGFLDEDGFLNLIDRKKDMIISGGYNVFPRNVEEAILEHPAVADVMVVGIPEPNLGQAVKAFIVQKDAEPFLTYGRLNSFLADKLATYEMPLEIEIRSNLPRTAVGKPSKKDLRV